MKTDRMQGKWFLFVLVGIIVVSLCGGCSAATATPQTIEVTRMVNSTQVVTQVVKQTVQVMVTATPLPLTSTPPASPTPAFARWKVSNVVEALKKANLEVENTAVMSKNDYGLAPMTASEGTRFFVPSLCKDCGGRIYSFATVDDLKTMQDYYVKLAKSSAAFFSWVFVKDNVLIQINGDLPEATAKKYEAALNSLK